VRRDEAGDRRDLAASESLKTIEKQRILPLFLFGRPRGWLELPLPCVYKRIALFRALMVSYIVISLYERGLIMRRITAVLCAAFMLALMLAGCGAKQETVFIGGVDDLVGKKIGVQEGTTGDIYAGDIEKAELSRYKKAVDAAIDLKNGKVDAVILDEQPAKRIVENNPDLAIIDEDFTQEDYAIGVRKEDTELLASINATLKRIKEDGKFQSFLDAYIPESGEPTVLPERPATNFKDTIVMGTNAEFEPFEYKENGKIVGFDVEIANEIAADLGKNLKIEDMNFDSLINALTSGKIDMILAGYTALDERKKSIAFSDSYYTSTQVIIVRKTSMQTPAQTPAQ